MTWLLGKLSAFFEPYLLYALGAALVALGVWSGVQTHRLAIAKAETAEVRNAWTVDKANATAAALTQTAQYRVQEQGWQAQITKAQDDYTALQSTHASALAAQRVALADNGRLRSSIAAYATGGGASAPDSAASASARAASLGSLLAAALQADAEHASAAESNGDGVRTLLSAWPKNDDSITLTKLKLGG